MDKSNVPILNNDKEDANNFENVPDSHAQEEGEEEYNFGKGDPKHGQ